MAQTPASAQVTLELQIGADPIRGTVEDTDGQRRAFWGWLELIQALDTAARPRGAGVTQLDGGTHAEHCP